MLMIRGGSSSRSAGSSDAFVLIHALLSQCRGQLRSRRSVVGGASRAFSVTYAWRIPNAAYKRRVADVDVRDIALISVSNCD